ncbi:MAG: hypothetical protein COW00_16830 [Bdellovibrio sp. CG12_big_fil_rev_8_21_14_0_65_39_13]|nr:MAG: hypothetical protein COW78_10120 [Bdellovibrio sp. CG22_combo_CG10-13_8_21_14_all_39_27]PIQ58270.1 MAG: hypothetical protein COW00_16830 [Bdellovibrio sp. CG12_big_fil_rev_8_21_14_0_65_39_13]PIR36679.1 MAG: hypothetical protein COV37_02350 [Bdellovibrio sp. CG11_big_fil_rev_8_21_14_0_20_39_38]
MSRFTRKLIVFLICTNSMNVLAKKKSVTILIAAKETVQKELLFPARIVPGKLAQVIADYPSIVEKIEVNLGDKVDQSTVLIQLKHSDPLFNERRLKVKSPIEGRIAKIQVSEGSQIGRGEKLLVIAGARGEKILLEVPSKDLSQIHQAQTGTLMMDNESFKVVVKGISPLIDTATGTASAEIAFAADEAKRPSGILGKISLKANSHDGILIPEHAISYQGNNTFIKKVDNDKISKVAVKLGERIRDRVEIAEGIQAGEWVVERASGYLADGVEVEVQNPPKKDEVLDSKENKGI